MGCRESFARGVVVLAVVASACASREHADGNERVEGPAGRPVAHAPHVNSAPRDPDEWRGTHELATHVGTYVIRWRTEPGIVPLAQTFALDAWVFAASAAEVPLADVELDVDAGMPQHGHGLALRPRITRVAPGHWRVEGLRFHMPGRWELYFDVSRGARLERAQTSVVLE